MCREALKMVLLLPFLVPRTIIGLSALVILACLSYTAALGWCAQQNCSACAYCWKSLTPH